MRTAAKKSAKDAGVRSSKAGVMATKEARERIAAKKSTKVARVGTAAKKSTKKARVASTEKAAVKTTKEARVSSAESGENTSEAWVSTAGEVVVKST